MSYNQNGLLLDLLNSEKNNTDIEEQRIPVVSLSLDRQSILPLPCQGRHCRSQALPKEHTCLLSSSVDALDALLKVDKMHKHDLDFGADLTVGKIAIPVMQGSKGQDILCVFTKLSF